MGTLGVAGQTPFSRPVYWGEGSQGRAFFPGPITGMYECFSVYCDTEVSTGAPFRPRGSIHLGDNPNIKILAVSWYVRDVNSTTPLLQVTMDTGATGGSGDESIVLTSIDLGATPQGSYTGSQLTNTDFSSNDTAAMERPWLVVTVKSTTPGSEEYTDLAVTVWFCRVSKGHINDNPADD